MSAARPCYIFEVSERKRERERKCVFVESSSQSTDEGDIFRIHREGARAIITLLALFPATRIYGRLKARLYARFVTRGDRLTPSEMRGASTDRPRSSRDWFPPWLPRLQKEKGIETGALISDSENRDRFGPAICCVDRVTRRTIGFSKGAKGRKESARHSRNSSKKPIRGAPAIPLVLAFA